MAASGAGVGVDGGVIDLSSVLYDIDPVVWVPVGLLVLVLSISLPKSRRLSLRDSLVAFWYLFNGIIIHIFLDGCVSPRDFFICGQDFTHLSEICRLVGFARRVPFLFNLYCILDKYEHPSLAMMGSSRCSNDNPL